MSSEEDTGSKSDTNTELSSAEKQKLIFLIILIFLGAPFGVLILANQGSNLFGGYFNNDSPASTEYYTYYPHL